ncbi:MAG: glycine--tRNA ligase subunit beta [Chitinivibrionia bacterium]|nr:glycine--tRNA ligase subunit beta [Chitinivibrionia bacterium]
MSDFLLEIGCENLPASYVPPAIEQLAADAGALCGEARLRHKGVYTTGTPRRIVLVIRNLADVQDAKTETVTGPPVSKSYDAAGAPTQAALGFARSQGVALSKLKPVATPKGDYLGFTRVLKRRTASSLLKERLPSLIAGLRFPKSMRWERGGARFARPVRWIVCMHGKKAVRFAFAGVSSGNATHTVPWLAKKGIRLESAESYFDIMQRHGVIVHHEERKSTLRKLASGAASEAGLNLIDDPALLDELTFMLEEPGVFIGEFSEKYLALPPEVIVTAMKAHQRYFAMRGGVNTAGDLVPRFLSFFDGKKIDPADIRRGNEKVLRARLEDALFYWQEDLKRGIHGLAGKLDSIVFIEGLGSIKDKTGRVKRLMTFIDGYRGAPRLSAATIEKVALLAKADLASEMVKDGKEFTLLEGLIGSHYASAAGEDREVVDAVREQYAPRALSDPLPESRAGTCASMADRADSICGCFLAGLIPTGSQDPYALRRQAIGLIRLLERFPLVPIDKLLEASISCYKSDGLPAAGDFEGVLLKLEEFFKGRLEGFIRERGAAYDVVNAVIQVSWAEPSICIERCLEIQKRRKSKPFELLITGVKRVGNILPKDRRLCGLPWDRLDAAFEGRESVPEGMAFSPDLFEAEVEHRLLREAKAKLPELRRFEQSLDFNGVLNVLSSLGPVIDGYFDTVLVNCDREAVRENRINFLAGLFALFSRYADFSLIVEEG